MYAVIESGGKQYKVAIGDRLKVESLDLVPGASVDLESVLFLRDGDDVKVGSPFLGSTVTATVVGHGRGEKIRIFKMRRRKNSRQRTGHRQNFTELEIVSIDGKTADLTGKAAPASDSTPEPVEAADTAPEGQIEDTAVEASPADAAPEQEVTGGETGGDAEDSEKTS